MLEKIKALLGIYAYEEIDKDLIYVELKSNILSIILDPYTLDNPKYKIKNSFNFHYNSFIDTFNNSDYTYTYDRKNRIIFRNL